MMSFTRAGPIRSDRRLRLPWDRQLPSVRAIGKPKRASRVAMRRSQAAAIAAPPPVQAPAIAAMVGTRIRSRVPSTRSMKRS